MMFYRQENWGLEGLSNFPKVKELALGEEEFEPTWN